MNKSDFDLLKITLLPFKYKYEYIPILYSDEFFDNSFPNLHGNKFTYSKLAIPQLIDEERILYLDVDIVVNLDVKELFFEDLSSSALGASGVVEFTRSLEYAFFKSLGFKGNENYFNAGMMLMDLKKWREQKIIKKALEFALKNKEKLRSHDQTIFNYIFHNNYKILDEKYNIKMFNYLQTKQLISKKGIYHFFGKPKPYDLFGELFNPHASVYIDVLDKTTFNGYRTWKNISISKIKHMFRIYKSYIRSLFRF